MVLLMLNGNIRCSNSIPLGSQTCYKYEHTNNRRNPLTHPNFCRIDWIQSLVVVDLVHVVNFELAKTCKP